MMATKLNNGISCPECGYDGGKYGHTKQLNPNNPNDLICSSCSYAFKNTFHSTSVSHEQI